MEALIIFLVFNILILFWAYYYKYRTKWNIIVQTFPVVSEPNGESLIGTHSAFQSSISKYPIVNTVIKFILCQEGLYVKYELFFEWPRFYKPVLIPWNNLYFLPANEWEKDGYDKYQIYHSGHYLGQIKIQSYISRDILIYIEKERIKLIKK